MKGLRSPAGAVVVKPETGVHALPGGSGQRQQLFYAVRLHPPHGRLPACLQVITCSFTAWHDSVRAAAKAQLGSTFDTAFNEYHSVYPGPLACWCVHVCVLRACTEAEAEVGTSHHMRHGAHGCMHACMHAL